MTASAVSFRAWIAAGLLVFGHSSDLHEPFQSFAEDAALLAGGFVHAFDGFTPPVLPKERPVGSIRTDEWSPGPTGRGIGRFNTIQLSTSPVKPMSVVINGRTSRSIQE